MGNGQEGDFYICTGFQGKFCLHRGITCTSQLYIIMCYDDTCILDQDADFKLQYMKHNIKIYTTVIQLSIIFSTIVFYYENCKSGRRKGAEWEATLNQGDFFSFPYTYYT